MDYVPNDAPLSHSRDGLHMMFVVVSILAFARIAGVFSNLMVRQASSLDIPTPSTVVPLDDGIQPMFSSGSDAAIDSQQIVTDLSENRLAEHPHVQFSTI